MASVHVTVDFLPIRKILRGGVQPKLASAAETPEMVYFKAETLKNYTYKM